MFADLSTSTTSTAAGRILLTAALFGAVPLGALAAQPTRATVLADIAVTTLADALPAKLSDHSATVLNDKIYIVGGCAGDQVAAGCPALSQALYIFDPATATFTTGANMPAARYRHSAEAIGTKLYIFGGRLLNDNLVATVDIFDSVAGSWSTSTTQLDATQQTSDACSWTMGLDIYVAGGYTGAYAAKKSVFKWTPTSANAAWTAVADMTNPRGDCRAVVRRDHTKAWVLGGYDSADWTKPVAHFESFDVTTGAWAGMTALSTARGDKAAVFWNDAVYALGGEMKDSAGNTVVLDTIEAYDAPTNAWTTATARLPTPKFRYAAAHYGGSIYVFGGQTTAVGTTHPVTSEVYVIASVSSCATPASAATRAGSTALATVALAATAAALLA